VDVHITEKKDGYALKVYTPSRLCSLIGCHQGCADEHDTVPGRHITKDVMLLYCITLGHDTRCDDNIFY
jgi:hypothetical protein